MYNSTHPTMTQLEQLMNRGALPVAAQFAIHAAFVLATWADRRKSRRILGRLDPHELRDIGLTKQQAADESQKAFWRV